MSETISAAPTRISANRTLPGFAAIFRGIWLMTWKSQFTAGKLPAQIGILLVLPILVFFTVDSPETWAARRISMGDTGIIMNSFARRLSRNNTMVQQATNDSLTRIVSDEIQEAQKTWQEKPGESADARHKRIEEHVGQCYDQISERAKPELNETQYDQFKSVLQREHDNVMRRLTEVDFPWSRTEPFYHWLMDFYFFIILPLTCVRGCGPLIRDELQADTLGFLITRPIGRARLLVAKYAAQVVWLEIILLLETGLVFAAGAARQVHDLGTLLPLLLAVQILVVPAWCALGALLGQLTARYMAVALLYGAVVEMGLGRIPTNINTLSIIRHLQTLLSRNYELQKIFAWPPGGTATAVVALVIAPVAFLGLSALLFSVLEYHHAAEMQK